MFLASFQWENYILQDDPSLQPQNHERCLLFKPLHWPSAKLHMSKGKIVPQSYILIKANPTVQLYPGSVWLTTWNSASYTARQLLFCIPSKGKEKILPWLVMQPTDHKLDHTECIFSLELASHPVQEKWKVKEKIISQNIFKCCQHISKSE